MQKTSIYAGNAVYDGNFLCAAELWLDQLEAEVKESTINRYRLLLESYVFPELGGMPVAQVGPVQVELLCRKLAGSGGREGRGLSQSTVAGTVTVIRGVLAWAGSGAARQLSAPRAPRQACRREIRVLSRDEQARLSSYLFSEGSLSSTGMLLSLFAGLRLGEVCALRWDDLPDDGTVHVRRTLQRLKDNSGAERRTRIVVTGPKTPCSVRVIPVPDAIRTVLDRRRQAKGYLLTGSDRYLEPRTMQYRFKQALTRSGVKDANYHALRHTFATRCVELGFDIKSLSEILGHSSVSVTLDRYVHPSLDMKRDNMRLLDGLLDDGLSSI